MRGEADGGGPLTCTASRVPSPATAVAGRPAEGDAGVGRGAASAGSGTPATLSPARDAPTLRPQADAAVIRTNYPA